MSRYSQPSNAGGEDTDWRHDRLEQAGVAIIQAAHAYAELLRDDKASESSRVRAHQELLLAVQQHDAVELARLAPVEEQR
jgi:hypothetical protein